MGQTASTVPMDSQVIFLKDGIQPVCNEEKCCEVYKTLTMRVNMPQKRLEKFDKVKIILYINGEEFKTREYHVAEMQKLIAGKNYWDGIIISAANRKRTDFDNAQFMLLDQEQLCFKHADQSYKSYKIEAVVKGLIRTGDDNIGRPLYRRQKIIATGQMSLKPPGTDEASKGGQQVSKSP